MIDKFLILASVFCISCSPNIDNTDSSSIEISESSDKNNFIEMGKMELDSSDGNYVTVSSEYFIKENNLQSKIDSAKWVVYLASILSENKLYCHNVDENGFLIEDTLSPVDFHCFTSLDLYLKEIRFEKDVMLFTFYFLNKEHNRLCGSFKVNTTIGFIKNDEMVYRDGGDYETLMQGYELQKEAELERRDKIFDSPKSDYTLYYYNSILQKYLDTTSCKINPWFRNEALRRGVVLNN
jgi:hypothetical protein